MHRPPLQALLLCLVLSLVSSLSGCKSPGSSAAPTPATASAVASAPPTRSVAVAPPRTPDPVWNRPLLWRIDAKDGGKPSYVFGTIHLPDARLDVMPPGLDQALASADAVYTEIPMDAGTQLGMAPKLMLPKGKTLKATLPNDLYAKVEAMFAAKGLPFAPFDTMKPWVVSTQLLLLDKMMLMLTKKPLDAVVYARAQSEGKKVGGLETVDEQLGVFDGLSLVLMPDVHPADGVCVGTVVASRSHVHPEAVGGDIGCGMAALRLGRPARRLDRGGPLRHIRDPTST
jgi:TraB/PrgY/gumN family/tRNA-splicing ligase RtcB